MIFEINADHETKGKVTITANFHENTQRFIFEDFCKRIDCKLISYRNTGHKLEPVSNGGW